MRCKRPCFYEVSSQAAMLSRASILQAQKFGNMVGDQALDLAISYLKTVLEQTVEQQTQSVVFGGWPLKVNNGGVHTLDLLKSIRVSISNRHNEHKQVGVFLGDLGQNLDEIEGPGSPGVLLGVGEAVIPRLEFIEDECRRRMLEEFQQNLVAGHIGPLVAGRLPLAFTVSAVRVVVE